MEHPDKNKKSLPNFDTDTKYWHKYRDEGCNLHPSCLSCPRATCQYDTGEEPQPQPSIMIKEILQEEIRNLLKKGYGIKTVALELGISTRTVYRAINRK